ncbi:hypothetical protein GCM10009114_15410 [Aliiglaciecola litoralis]|uniref:Uncharacterized protein n=1 Tax=Aliiglaciecola litoralis TaxID=582857 RepID=A0ABN1LHR0_9ALTE
MGFYNRVENLDQLNNEEDFSSDSEIIDESKRYAHLFVFIRNLICRRFASSSLFITLLLGPTLGLRSSKCQMSTLKSSVYYLNIDLTL